MKKYCFSSIIYIFQVLFVRFWPLSSQSKCKDNNNCYQMLRNINYKPKISGLNHRKSIKVKQKTSLSLNIENLCQFLIFCLQMLINVIIKLLKHLNVFFLDLITKIWVDRIRLLNIIFHMGVKKLINIESFRTVHRIEMFRLRCQVVHE